MKTNLVVPVATLLAGVAVGYCVPRGGGGMAPESERPETKVVKVGLSDKSVVDALRVRNRELERQLAERGAKLDEAPPPGGAVSEQHERGPRNAGEFLEGLKRDNPEQYARVTNNMARFRAMRQDRTMSKMEFLSSIDTSRMSHAARETHERLQRLVASRAAIIDRIESSIADSGAEGESRAELLREMSDLSREINELNAQERDNLLNQTAEALGYEGEDVEVITATIKDIINNTGAAYMGPTNFGSGAPPGPGVGR